MKSRDLKLKWQLVLATILTLSGLGLLFVGFFVRPVGVIDWSVLSAFGECSTFAGALCGIDLTYKIKALQFEGGSDKKESEKE